MHTHPTHAPPRTCPQPFIRHYSQCSSVGEIVVVWNRGVPPPQEDLERDSLVPVRVGVGVRAWVITNNLFG